jgi:hypothetical protein
MRLVKLLPGEIDGEINPEDYGFDVIPDVPPAGTEAATRVAVLYAQTKDRTGVVIPKLESFLAEASTQNDLEADPDHDPA